MKDVAAYYNTYWSEDGFHPNTNLSPPLQRLLEAHITPGVHCLDVGCGNGQTAGLWLRDRGTTYVGVDISASAVAAARSLGLDARQMEVDAPLPFRNDQFDAVVCIEVLEHLFAPATTASEVLRVLRPGGLFLATVPNVAYWRRRVDLAVLGRWNPLGDGLAIAEPWRDPHIRFFNAGALRRMLEGTGFNPVWIGGHEGTLIGDLPGLYRLHTRGESSVVYRFAERIAPALFGARLHAVARKPAGGG